MIVMPVRATDPDRVDRPALVSAVELFAPAPVVPKPPGKGGTNSTRTHTATAPETPSRDPLTEARQQVAEANEALLTATNNNTPNHPGQGSSFSSTRSPGLLFPHKPET